MPTPPPFDPNLRDLDALGWEAGPRPPARASVERAQADSWGVARLWTTPTVLTSHPPARGTEGYRVILGIDGDASLLVEGQDIALRPGQLIVLDGSLTIRTENRALWARVEWHLRAPLLRHAEFAEHLSTAVPIRTSHADLIATTTNVISTNLQMAQGPGSPYLLDALTGIVAAAIADSTGAPSALTPAQAVIFQRAIADIGERFRDKDLSADGIARSLAVSRGYLHQVFTAARSTPRQEIESRRVAAALALLDASPSGGRGILERVADRSGFSSARQMRTAIRRQQDATASAPRTHRI
ncbi:AraC-like DNA-binding protein [Microbacterium resistens]|uniref:AraC-like DNA-binding protein n=1 Tax=Microbacterium resistens TaxID=156977 RepID=A0ABU1S9W2_9MICO|nr:hypothetical protein [Microbacterium resistens]MDR6866397.1 AraC-like DNA-binding protein [Microbacterium resistens]